MDAAAAAGGLTTTTLGGLTASGGLTTPGGVAATALGGLTTAEPGGLVATAPGDWLRSKQAATGSPCEKPGDPKAARLVGVVHTKALRPVMARPVTRELISRVPS